MSSSANVVIIAAGLGSRLAPLTDNTPKCMLHFAGKTLLERQIDAYLECGITDISVVRGYAAERINLPNLTYFENLDFKNSNQLNSLFHAESVIRGDTICAFSDILFDSQVPEKLLKSKYDISIVVDTDWQRAYEGRVHHPIEEAENVIFDHKHRGLRIGKHLSIDDGVDGEFIGMLKLSPVGANLIRGEFHKAKAKYWDKPFQEAASFQQACITDMIQAIIDGGHKVHCVTIEQGWREIDTEEDYQKAIQNWNLD